MFFPLLSDVKLEFLKSRCFRMDTAFNKLQTQVSKSCKKNVNFPVMKHKLIYFLRILFYFIAVGSKTEIHYKSQYLKKYIPSFFQDKF